MGNSGLTKRQFKDSSIRRRGIWLAVLTGIFLPILGLSIFSFVQLKKDLKNRHELTKQNIQEQLTNFSQDLDDQLTNELRLSLRQFKDLSFSDNPLITYPFFYSKDWEVSFPYSQSLRNNKQDKMSKVWIEALREAGKSLIKDPRNEKSIEVYEAGLKTADATIVLKCGLELGAIYFKDKNYSKALAVYQKSWETGKDLFNKNVVIIGAQYILTLNKMALYKRQQKLTGEWVKLFLSTNALKEDIGITILIEMVREQSEKSPGADTVKSIWDSFDSLSHRAELQKILDDWGSKSLQGFSGREEIFFLHRIDPLYRQALIFWPDASGGGVGGLLDLKEVERWFRHKLEGSKVIPKVQDEWRWNPVTFYKTQNANQELSQVVSRQLPFWQIEGMPLVLLAESEPSHFFGMVQIVSLITLILFFFCLMMWTLKREWALQAMKENFVSAASHELRTPLALIRTAGETLYYDRSPSEKKTKSYIEVIVRESIHLSHLIGNILDFSRIKQGEYQFNQEFIETNFVIEAQVADIQKTLNQGQIVWNINIEKKLPPLFIDQYSLLTVLMNLIDNALKFSVEGDPYVGLSVSQNNKELIIEVEDHGLGIPADEKKRVFDRFYRGQHIQKRVTGTGIGLALVHHIVTSQQGKITIEDVFPQGSIFRITFPVLSEGMK